MLFLTNEQKVEELTATIVEFEDLRAVSEELEESQEEAMKELRTAIRMSCFSVFCNYNYCF